MGDGWLETQDLPRSQFRSPRRGRLNGQILLHTAEGVMDSVGPDTGAENVARFIAGRSDPGSYHDLCDSDSTMHLVDYDDEAYHDATGRNRSTTSVSFACRTVDWARMTAPKRRAFLAQGAAAAARQARHHQARTGKIVRPVRLTKAQADRGETGFLYHGDSDPSRRSDPGTKPEAPFPWDEFIALYEIAAADLLNQSEEDEDMPLTDADKAWIKKTVDDSVNRAIGVTLTDEASDQRVWGSLRGWVAAIAEKVGVTRDDAIRLDPTHKEK